MRTSAFQAATRAFLSLTLSLAQAYQVIVHVTRESDKATIQKAFWKVSVKVHPDKGGDTADFQRLTAARMAMAEKLC